MVLSVNRKFCTVLLLLHSPVTEFNAYAQDDPNLDPQQEVWPELNIYYHINDNFRLYSLISGTKVDQSDYSEGAFSIFVDYF